MIAKRELKLKYGNKKIILQLADKNIAGILSASQTMPLDNPTSTLEGLLEKPLNTDSLDQLIKIKKAKKILIIVNDITRPTPYSIMLPPLLAKLVQAGVKKEDIFLWLLPELTEEIPWVKI